MGKRELVEKEEQLDKKIKNRFENFSFSKLDTYIQCPRRYKLKYVDGNYATVKSLPLEMGTLIHYINENIADLIINGKPIDYDYWKKQIFELDKPNTSTTRMSNAVRGVNLLEEEYLRQFVTESEKSGLTYSDKIDTYIENIKDLEKMHKEGEWKILDTEVEFSFIHKGKYNFRGFIDRVDIHKETGDIRVIDYKTKDRPFEHRDLTTPMQMVIYAIACVEKYGKLPVEFIYDLVFLNLKQHGGTKGFLRRGERKLNSTLQEIESGDFKPKPTPLCHWCEFSATNPDAPAETKGLCPFYSLWTRDNPTFQVNKVYSEMEEKIAEQLNKKSEAPKKLEEVKAEDINLDLEDF